MSSSFDISCPVSIPVSTTHDCGVDKTLSWSSNGTVTNAQSFTFKYSLLNNLQPNYVTITPHVTKLFKFTFTPNTTNNADITVYLKQVINGNLTILAQWNLNKLASPSVKYYTILLDSLTKVDLNLFFDIKTSNGTSGNITANIDCEPQLYHISLCGGFTTNNSSQYCFECPQVFNFYKNKTTSSGISNAIFTDNFDFTSQLSGVWYKEDLQTEVDENTIFTIKGNSSYTYTNSSHSATPGFTLYTDCKSGSAGSCLTTYSGTVINADYTATTPYVKNAQNIKDSGLKYAIKEYLIKLPTNNRKTTITVAYDNLYVDDISFVLTDGTNNDDVGFLSYQTQSNPVIYKPIINEQKFVVNEVTSHGFLGFIGGRTWAHSKSVVAITATGYIKVKVAFGSPKNRNVQSINFTVTATCGNEIFGYDMGVNPYSSYDSYYSPAAVTAVYSETNISGWTTNTLVYNDALLFSRALPYFYGDNVRANPTHKVYQIGSVIKRTYGTHRNYKVVKWFLGPRKTYPVIDGPKDWLSTVLDRDHLETVYSCVEPSMEGVGVLRKIINTSDLHQPTKYSYYLGYATNQQDESIASSSVFVAWNPKPSVNFSSGYDGKYTPITGFQHMMTKMSRSYGFSIPDPDLHGFLNGDQYLYFAFGMVGLTWLLKAVANSGDFIGHQTLWGPNSYQEPMGDALYDEGVGLDSVVGANGEEITLYESQFQAAAYRAVAWFYVAWIVATLIVIAIQDNSITFDEYPCRWFKKRYSNKPFLGDGTPIYSTVTGSTFVSGTWCDGSHFFNIPDGSTDGKITSNKLSYSVDSDNKKTYSLPVLNPSDFSKPFYIVDFHKLLMLSYTAGYPEQYNTTVYSSNSISSVTVTLDSSVIGDLNNSLPITHEIPAGLFTSTISLDDANNQAQAYYNTLTGITSSSTYQKSIASKPGVETLEMTFTHEIKDETTPNTSFYFYDNSDSNGLTVGKKLYKDFDGLFTSLNGYYSIEQQNGVFKTMYKLSYGVVTDILVWANSSDTTVTSQYIGGTYNVVTSNQNLTSDWYLNSIISTGSTPTWNTQDFYNSWFVVKGLVDDTNQPNTFYLYDNNLTGSTLINADSLTSNSNGVYTSLINKSSFTYYSSHTLYVNSEEITTIDNQNGVNFYLTDDSAGTNLSPSYVGLTFDVNLYTGSSVLYSATTVTFATYSSSQFVSLDIPNTGHTITSVYITSNLSQSSFNKVSFVDNSTHFKQSTGITFSNYYYGTQFIVDSYGYIMYTDQFGTIKYEYYTEGIYTLGNPIIYNSLASSDDNEYHYPPASIRILFIGNVFLPKPEITVSSFTNVTCWNGNDGTITFSATNGDNSPYEYSIDNTNWQSSPTFTGLNGTTSYTGYVRNSDNTGYVAQTSGTTTLSTTAPSANYVITNVTCNGGSNGSIYVYSPSGGGGTSYSASTDGSTYYSIPHTFGSLTNGAYTVYIKDNLGCVATSSKTITQPTALSISLGSITTPTCYNSTDGSFSATASGGTSPYVYQLNNGATGTTHSWSSLSNGTYTVKVTDANGCIATGSTTFNTTAPNATITVTNATCNGGTGSISVSNGTGGAGVGGYSASTDNSTWTVINSTPITYSNLSAGAKTIYIRDGNGCVQSYSKIITQPTAVTSSITGTAPNCYNGSDGSITVTPGGGSGVYTYSLNGGAYQSSNTFTGLTNSTYNVTVKDSNGCTATSSNLTFSSTAPNATISSASVSCNGGSDGTITVRFGTGGNGSTYSASLNGTNYYTINKTFTGLTAGNYTVYIQDDLGCTATYTKTVGQPANPLSVSLSTTPATCWDSNDAAITATGSGGTSPYTYSLNNGTYSGTRSWSNLFGYNYNYLVTIKDAKGCTATASVYFNTTPPNATITPSNYNGYTIACNGGTGTLVVSNGTGGSGSGYSVSVDNLTYYSLPHTFTVNAGTTTVYVQDGSGCIKSYSQTITQPTALTQNITGTNPTCYNGSDGTVSTTASGGVSPYQYSYNGGSYGSTRSWTGLTTGSYTIAVKDSNGCVVSGGASLSKSAPNATISVTNVTCYGGNGSIAVSSGTGGSGSGYSASTDNSTYYVLPKTFTLSAGSYTIYIKDSAGCVQSYSQTITQPTAVTSTISSNTPPTCFNGNNGSLTATAGGGVSPYTYSLNGGTYQSSATFTGLTNGTYTVTVKDANGCTTTSSSVTFAVTAPNATITPSNHSGYNISCNGGSDGAIVVTGGSGGSGSGYQASIDNVTYYPISATQQKTFGSLNVANNDYYIYIKDGSGCIQSYGPYTMTQPPVNVCTISVYQYDSGANDGQIAVVVSGGAGVKTLRLYQDTSSPYNDFSTDNLLQTATSVANNTTYYFTGIPCIGGDYWVQVTDDNGCVIHSSTEIKICGFHQTLTLYKTANNLTCTPVAPFSRINLNGFDFTNYTNAGNILGVGMTLYTDGNGTIYPYNTIYDSVATTIWSVSSGVITGVATRGNC